MSAADDPGRAELVARLARYREHLRLMSDARAREALQDSIEAMEAKLAAEQE